MTKLPSRKSKRKNGGPVTTSSQLGTSKSQPKKNFKNGIKQEVSSGSSPKPTKTTDSKAQLTQMKTNKNKSLSKTRKPKKRGRRASSEFAKKRLLLEQKRRVRNLKKDQKLMEKFANNVKESPKDKVKKVDPTQLINLEMVQTAISGLRKLPSNGKTERKSLHDMTDEDERLVYLQVTLCKLPKVNTDFHLTGPTTISVYLPNSLVTDNTDVILITKDLQRGIKRDHQNSLNHFKELLNNQGATSLINEVIPLRQLKVEYKEFEAKRLLANRTDVLLCDDTVMRFIPKFLTKHFYTKKRLPVQVNLKAKDLQKEFLRALSVSKLFLSMKGISSIMKIGRIGQTDDEIQENVLAAVQKLASHAPGQWANIQGLSLKLERTTSIPIHVKMGSLNEVKPVPARPLFPGESVSGTLTTQPGKCITVFPDGSVTSTGLFKNRSRLAEEKVTSNETKELGSKKGKKSKRGKKSGTLANNVELPETETEVSSIKQEVPKNSTKRKTIEKKSSKAKKQKKTHGSGSDSDSGEDDLEEQEMMYLKQLNRDKESTGNQEEDEDSEDVWADSASDIEDSD